MWSDFFFLIFVMICGLFVYKMGTRGGVMHVLPWLQIIFIIVKNYPNCLSHTHCALSSTRGRVIWVCSVRLVLNERSVPILQWIYTTSNETFIIAMRRVFYLWRMHLTVECIIGMEQVESCTETLLYTHVLWFILLSLLHLWPHNPDDKRCGWHKCEEHCFFIFMLINTCRWSKIKTEDVLKKEVRYEEGVAHGAILPNSVIRSPLFPVSRI